MTEALFNRSTPLSDLLERSVKSLQSEASNITDVAQLNDSSDTLRDKLVEKYSVIAPTIDKDAISSQTQHDIKVDASGRQDMFVDKRNPYVPGTLVTFRVPFTGDALVFQHWPNGGFVNGLEGSINSGAIEFAYLRPVAARDEIESAFEADLAFLEKSLTLAVSETARFNEALPERVGQIIALRRSEVGDNEAFEKSLKYPRRD